MGRRPYGSEPFGGADCSARSANPDPPAEQTRKQHSSLCALAGLPHVLRVFHFATRSRHLRRAGGGRRRESWRAKFTVRQTRPASDRSRFRCSPPSPHMLDYSMTMKLLREPQRDAKTSRTNCQPTAADQFSSTVLGCPFLTISMTSSLSGSRPMLVLLCHSPTDSRMKLPGL
jgi:hypothetical protein